MTYKEAMKIYPDIPGCTSCYYWRTISGSHPYRKKNCRYLNPDLMSYTNYCCHYGQYNNRPRDTSDMGFACPHRKPIERKNGK